MPDVLTSLFENSIFDFNRRGNSLVYLALPDDSTLFDRISQVVLEQTMMTDFANYHCSRITAGTCEFAKFAEKYPLATAPSFNIVSDKIQRVFAAEDAPAQFLAFLQQREANTTNPQTADTDRSVTRTYTSNERVILSIRLPSGETVRGTFDANHTLKYVGRWLEREHKVLLASEKDVTPDYRSGLPEPLRYAFFCPGTRVSFCEGQEFCQLKTLGLSPRLALILKPEYDTRALEAHANYSTLRTAQAKVTSMLHALYSFFDYGVDDAQRDLQNMTKDDLPIAVPGLLPMDLANKTSARIVGPTINVESSKESGHLPEVITREGTPAPGTLDTLV